MSLGTKEHKNARKQSVIDSTAAFLNGFGWVLRVNQKSGAFD